jgi:hypothetical protein
VVGPLAFVVARAARLRHKQAVMNFFKKLFGIHDNPTSEWPELPAITPMLDLRREQIGPLPFNSSITDAKTFGKPDRYQPNAGNNPHLLYARAGFALDYELGVLVYVTFYLAPDEYAPVHPAMQFRPVSVIVADGQTHELTAETQAEALVAAFGKPLRADVDDDESVLVWKSRKLTLEAELNAQARLKALAVYLTD